MAQTLSRSSTLGTVNGRQGMEELMAEGMEQLTLEDNRAARAVTACLEAPMVSFSCR